MANRSRKKPVPVPTVERSPWKSTLEFDDLPLMALRRYCAVHKLKCRCPRTFQGEMLDSEMGHRTWSYKYHQRDKARDVAALAKRDFSDQNIRETETIADFIYAVSNQDLIFKLKFTP